MEGIIINSAVLQIREGSYICCTFELTAKGIDGAWVLASDVHEHQTLYMGAVLVSRLRTHIACHAH